MTTQYNTQQVGLTQEQSYQMAGQSPVVDDSNKTVNIIGIIGLALPIFLLLCTILYKKLFLKKSFTKNQIIRRAVLLIIYYFVILVLHYTLKVGLGYWLIVIV